MRRLVWHYGIAPQRLGSDDNATFAERSCTETVGWTNWLRRLQSEYNYRCEVHMFSLRSERAVYHIDGLKWVFHPLSLDFLSNLSVRGTDVQSLAGVSPSFFRDLREDPPDLFGFYIIGNVLAPLIGGYLRSRDVPYFVKVFRQEQSGIIHNLVYRGATALWAETKDTANALSRRQFAPNTNIEVIPQAVNENLFRPSERSTSNDSGPVLGFIGRLDERKRFLLSLEALDVVRARHPSVTLHVRGDFITNAYEAKAEAEIARRDLEENIVFHKFLDPNKLVELYRELDLLLFPSRRETFGRVLVESMMCGTPAVAVRGSVGPEAIIDDGQTGVITTEAEFPSTVANLIDRSAELHAMGKRAAMAAEDRYSLAATTPAFERFCSELIE